MALIGHRCRCGHNDINHVEDNKGKRTCTASNGGRCKHRCKPVTDVQPEVMPTFDRKGNTIARIVRPGDGLSTEAGTTGVNTCACDKCQALYAQLVPAA